MKFGLACEGITDQITLENILCGYFEEPDLDESIHYLQPGFDVTDQKQMGGGGWNNLFGYLKIQSFRDAVINHDCVIIQIDTDVCEQIGFDISLTDAHDSPLDAGTLIAKVIEKLISIIDHGQPSFYQAHAEKIIFAISVHSLECWLVAYYADNTEKHRCDNTLKAIMKPQQLGMAKNKRNYDRLSQPFLNYENIEAVMEKDLSFKYFIRNLVELTK